MSTDVINKNTYFRKQKNFLKIPKQRNKNKQGRS